jgi:hypothetical protein
LYFREKVLKNSQIPNFLEIRPVGTELFQTRRQMNVRTGMNDEDNSHFSKICEGAYKKIVCFLQGKTRCFF